jgi:hypothetical protein
MQAGNAAADPNDPSEGAAARWNSVRCPRDVAGQGAARGRGHVESYFLKLNDREGRRALWVKATILAHAHSSLKWAAPVAEAWAIAFDREGRHVAVKDTVPLESARFGDRGLDVIVRDLRLTPGRIEGSVGDGERRIAFDLRFTMDAPPLVPFPSERMYETPLPSSKLVSPHPDSIFDGTYSVGGQTIAVDGWRGMEGHNWGTRHTELYAWCHVNEWQGERDFVFEGLTGRTKVGPILVPPLTVVCVRHRGVRYDFNSPSVMARAHGAIDAFRSWTFRSKTAHAAISGEVWAQTEDFVGLAYENPDGAITHCLNSKIARARIRLSVAGRPDLDLMSKAAAFEIGTKKRGHGVAILA